MREIKFRAWTGSTMEYRVMAGWLGAFYVQGIDEKDSACMSPFNTIYSKETPVMQFTGLLDKNGKEIYEGDILRVPDCTELQEISWTASRISIRSLPENDDYEDLWRQPQYSLEVIGNIYEHGHLLSNQGFHDKI